MLSMSETTWEREREAALQYHIDHCERGRALIVDARLLNVISIPRMEVAGLTSRQFDRLLRTRQIPVVVRDGEQAYLTTLPRRAHTVEERFRFGLSSLREMFERDSRQEGGLNESKGRKVDWYCGQVYLKPVRSMSSSHSVRDADLAYGLRANVEAHVAVGCTPYVVTVGVRRRRMGCFKRGERCPSNDKQ
jgi:hypothetical protein